MQWIDHQLLVRAIQNLDDTSFAALSNALLAETAVRNGIDRSHLSLNLKVTEPDGGIDAQCIKAPRTVGLMIPRTSTDYQFKGGRNPKSVAKIVAEDVRGSPRVISGLKEGHGFVYLAGWDRGNATTEALKAGLVRAGVNVENDQVVFMPVDSIAHQLESFPSLLVKFLNIDLGVT